MFLKINSENMCIDRKQFNPELSYSCKLPFTFSVVQMFGAWLKQGPYPLTSLMHLHCML